MSAAPQLARSPVFAFEPADWLPASEAAERLDVNRDGLTRKCREQLADAGLAIYKRLPGSPPGWLIHRSYDPRLNADQDAIEAPDLDKFTDYQQQLAWARWDCVCRFRQARDTRSGAISSWLPGFIEELRAVVGKPLAERFGKPLKISRRTLYEWDRRCATIADIAELIDKRGGDQTSRGSGAFWEYFGSLFLTDDRRTMKACWRRAREWAKAEGVEACSYQSLRRQIDQRIPPLVQLAHRDPKKYRDQCEPTARLDSETFAVNQRWESDQRRCDVRVVMPDGSIGRPVLTAWIDWRTRRCVGYRVEAYGDSETICVSLHAALTDESNIGGPPEIAWTDNGVDYLSVGGGNPRKRIADADVPTWRGIYAMLGIELHLALPKGPRGKSRIERWFQTKGQQLDAFLPGYCGNEPKNRPESLAAKEKDPAQLMTLGEYRRRVQAWIAQYNADDEHDKADLAEDGVKLSPDEAYQRWCPAARRFEKPEALKYLLMRWHKPLTVSKDGVRIEVDGQSFYYGGSETKLIPYRGNRGKVKRYVFAAYDPHDVSSIYVWEAVKRGDVHEPGAFICQAMMNHAGGAYGTEANRQQMKQIARERRRFNRAVKEYRSEGPRQLMRPEERLILAAQKSAKPDRTGGGDDDTPLAIRPVQTAIDSDLKAIRDGELRQAAGAETNRPRVNLADAMARIDAKGGRSKPASKPRLRLSDALEGASDESR